MAGYDVIRRARIAAVGGGFLRVRPFVAGIGAVANFALVASSTVPSEQRIALGATTGGLVLAFACEALALRRRDADARWLATSLASTIVVLGGACLISGGATSPILPLLFAPLAIALAAFGSAAPARIVVALAGLVLAVLLAAAFDRVALPFPSLPAALAARMSLVSAAVSVTLVTLGVSRLAEAHRTAGLALERTRAGVLDDALDRARLAETMGIRIAHEIRNPLTSIKALVALVARGDIDARNAKRLDVALEEIERIAALVSDYLSLVRPLDVIAPRPIDARTLVEEVAAVLEGTARDAGVIVIVDAAPSPFVGDARRLREALLNLGANAVRAMRGGSTRALTLRASPQGSGVRIEVIDTGPGIDGDALRNLGAPFASAGQGGVGLGVLLARGVAAQHGGELRFESEAGRGTRAILDLPLRPPMDAASVEDLGDGEHPDRR